MSVEYIILVCLLVIIFLLWKNNDKFISSSSNDWLILVWYLKSDPDKNVKTIIHIQFVPIVGWRYNHWSHKYGNLSPITPPIYQVKDQLEDSNECVRCSYWIRDGREYGISSEWTSRNYFWEDLTIWVEGGFEINIETYIPDSLQTKVHNILKLKKNNKE